MERNTHWLVKWVLAALLWLTHFFGMEKRHPNYAAARDAIPRVEDAQLLATRDILSRTPPAYERALRILRANRAAAERMLAERRRPAR